MENVTPAKAPHEAGVIELNVGGAYFATTWRTLMKYPSSLLAAMFSQQNSSSFDLVKDSCGRYFIDRDAAYFSIILNFLRTGEVYIPAGVDKERVASEADYYGIEELSGILTKDPTPSDPGKAGQAEKPTLSELLRKTTMDTWRLYAESKYKEYLPKIMEKLQTQAKTHPFFEAEISMICDTDEVSRVQVMASYKDVGGSFLIVVPLKFIGQPICEVWSEFLASEGFKVSYSKTSASGKKELWSIFISWFNKYKKQVGDQT